MTNTLNLTLRFLLEVGALLSMGMWGWQQATGGWRYALATLVPVVAMGLWTTFAVPGDPSRSGNAPVVIPGYLRLFYEAIFFGFASWTLWQTKGAIWGGGFATVVLFHYVVSYERVTWLLQQ